MGYTTAVRLDSEAVRARFERKRTMAPAWSQKYDAH